MFAHKPMQEMNTFCEKSKLNQKVEPTTKPGMNQKCYFY